LIFVGYKAFAETPELMPVDAKSSLLYLFAILPAVFSVLAVIPMIFYNLTGKKHKEIIKALEEKRQQSLDKINSI
jgi:Na+/melibiose symporter-like transporter